MRARGWRGESSREAPGHEPDRIVQGHGHDVRGFVRAAERIPLGGLRFHRQHFGFDGSVRRARQYAQPGTDSGRENFLGKLSQSLDYGALTCQLRTDFDGCVRILNELVRQKPVYLLNSVNPYRIEGQKTAPSN